MAMANMDELLDRLERAYDDDELALSPDQGSATTFFIPVIDSDVSARGARLSGDGLPEQNALISLRADELVIEARVAWSIGTACCIEFEEPLGSSCPASLERRGVRGQLYRLSS
jgi:hypothetical protein